MTSKKPVRFLLVSTHTEQLTGYSKVSHNLLKQLSTLQPLVKIFHFGFQRSPVRPDAPMRPLENVIQYDAAANEEPRQQGFGFNKLAEYVDTVSPDIVMIYNDPLVVNGFLDALSKVEKTFKTWVYLDLVYEGVDQGLLRNIETRADRIFCFTPKWKEYLLSRLPATEKQVDVLEHGVDTLLFKPSSDAERIATRKTLNIPPEAVVFLNMNRNSERKRLDLSVMAFARLVAKYPTLPLYMLFVCNMSQQSGIFYHPVAIFIEELNRLRLSPADFGSRVCLVDTSPPRLLDDKTIASLYGAADYGINTANGEGFGLCQLEHLATGAPQVVVDVGDYRCFLDETVAEIVPVTSYSYLSIGAGVGKIAKTASVEDVTAAMDRILSNKRSSVCVEKAKTRPWSKVCDPFLETIISTAL